MSENVGLRQRRLTEALRPARNTDAWRRLTPEDIPPQALEGITRVDAATPQEEADIIALLLREALETKGKTAALVTPDRRLARRVTESLKRWGINIDDTGGQPLSETPVGRYVLLLAAAAAEQLAPVALLSLLKHPCAVLFPDRARHDAAVLDLDRYVLRGPRPDSGLAGLRDAFMRQSGDIPEDSAARVSEAIEKIDSIFSPLLHNFSDTNKNFAARLASLLHAAEALAGSDADLWRGVDGEAAADFFAELITAAQHVPPQWYGDDHALLRILMKDTSVRPRNSAHARLSILGLIEARLQGADLVILGGLNEGTWPALPPPDPWMSRPMRLAFGLPAPEKMIGITAHDFVQAAAGGEVVLTRALRADGAPTVPARWLQRLDAVLKAVGLEWPPARAAQLRAWRMDMDRPGVITPASRPAPCPPVALRPRRLSVTKIERWMRDPYQIYAQYVLGLEPLDPLDADPGGAERGVFIHAALEAFIKRYPEEMPEDAVEKLLALGRKALSDLRIPREVEAFWWPRFERIAAGFVEQERAWRAQASPHLQEIFGLWTLDMPGGKFSVSGKADRIDRLHSGGFAIIDYKSGQVPESTDVRRGLSPQLPLEAVMLAKGAFPGVQGDAHALIYWKVSGSGQAPVEQKSVLKAGDEFDDALKAAEIGLQQLIARFDDAATPYYSQPLGVQSGFSDYDYLARVREWAQNAEGEGE
jgi:ATP-dependent helicase/nuclease subunit B